MTEVFLVLHGTGGNKPDHWQEHLVRELRELGKDVRYPQMPEPNAPELDPWMAALHRELDAVADDAALTVLAHSRGCILWMHHACMAAAGEKHGPQAERALLVAPPYRTSEISPTPPSKFFPAPLSAEGIAALSRQTAIVASDDDEFSTYEQAEGYAAALGIPIYKLSGAGHISPFYGYGKWPWVVDWCLGGADLPPLPNR